MDLVKLVAAVQTIVRGRANEGSTWAGVGVIAATVGQLIGGPWGAVLIALGPLLGAVAVALPDKGAAPDRAAPDRAAPDPAAHGRPMPGGMPGAGEGGGL